MSTTLSASDRLRIGRALITGATGETLKDCAEVARVLVGGADLAQVLGMPELTHLPEVRVWLARELGRAAGVLMAEAA